MQPVQYQPCAGHIAQTIGPCKMQTVLLIGPTSTRGFCTSCNYAAELATEIMNELA